jgi:hypothetical protein
MAKSDLLKQAIADAKAVKETALENAKIALQEAFEPKVKSVLEKQLRYELEGDEEEFGDEMSAEAPMGDEAGFEGEEEGEGVEWVDNDLSFKVGGQQFQAQVNDPMGDEEEFGEEGDEFGDEGGFGDEMPAEEMPEDELNLEDIIRELEGADEVPVAANDEYLEDGEEDTELTMGLHGESIDDIIESILQEEYDEEEEKPAMKKKHDEDEDDDIREEMEAMTNELEEAYATVSELKAILSEVNLLNAKLLYTKKLFRNFELTEGQKMKVIENFDRTVTTREVKLVFTTLAESFNKPRGKRNPVVKESVASKPMASTAPKKETTQVLSEGFEQANRWKKLAGLL